MPCILGLPSASFAIPYAKSWLIGKDSDAGRDWGQEEKGTTEDEMSGWHHWLDGRESERTPGVGDGQGGLACCDSWSHKESDTTERLIWSDLNEAFKGGQGGSQEGLKWLEVFTVFKGWSREWGFLHMARGLYDLNCLPVSSEGVCRLSYQLAQIWGRKERGRGETQKLSSVKHTKDGGRLYIHTSLYNPIHWCRSGICDLFLSIEYD